MTVVVDRRVKDYNELVEVAHKRLSNRLRRFAGMADLIDDRYPDKAAEQAG